MKGLNLWAERYGIPLTIPATHDSILANIRAVIANKRGIPTDYAMAV